MTRLPESVICWKWKPQSGYRSTYGPETVNALFRMVSRHYRHPHRQICVTDDPRGIDPAIEIVPMWMEYAHIPSPHGRKNPSCYRRLRAFAPDAADFFGARFVSLDLDTVIVDDLTPVWDRPEDFVIWGDTNPQPGSHYNGSMFLSTAGTRTQAWTAFDPATSPRLSLQAGCWGSDQGWLSYVLGGGEARWTTTDGVYSYRNHIKAGSRRLPVNARVVSFHGNVDPWSLEAQRLDWVRAHYGVVQEAA